MKNIILKGLIITILVMIPVFQILFVSTDELKIEENKFSSHPISFIDPFAQLKKYLKVEDLMAIPMNHSAAKNEINEINAGRNPMIIDVNIIEDVESYAYSVGPLPLSKRNGIPEDMVDKLSYVTVPYYDFDGKTHMGELIVSSSLAEEVVEIFLALYEAKYPIEKMKIISDYDNDDNLSMEDNNSSAFCYRNVASYSTISNHSKGIAIDINPKMNPYIVTNSLGTTVLPASGRMYADRAQNEKGMIREGDPCYEAFISRGWAWGGHWNSVKDYQHFEKTNQTVD